jgi:hypothetical protein
MFVSSAITVGHPLNQKGRRGRRAERRVIFGLVLFPFKLVIFAPRLFTEVNAERAFHHLTNRYTFVGRFALELSAKLIADLNDRPHA